MSLGGDALMDMAISEAVYQLTRKKQSMQVQGTVVQINMNAQIKKQAGGTYEGWQLVYNTPDGEVKTIAKPSQSLKYKGPLKAALSSLTPGDEFTLEMDKNNAGFWDVLDCSKGKADSAGGSPGKPAAPTSGKNNYETSEERAARQVMIVRQSSLGHAINFISLQKDYFKGTENPLAEVISIAKQLENFVMGKEVAVAPGFEDFENDIPL